MDKKIKKLLTSFGEMLLILTVLSFGIYSSRASRGADVSLAKIILVVIPYFIVWVVLSVVSFVKYGESFDLLIRRNQHKSDFHFTWNTRFNLIFLVLSLVILMSQLFLFNDYYQFLD